MFATRLDLLTGTTFCGGVRGLIDFIYELIKGGVRASFDSNKIKRLERERGREGLKLPARA